MQKLHEKHNRTEQKLHKRKCILPYHVQETHPKLPKTTISGTKTTYHGVMEALQLNFPVVASGKEN